jgi:rubredoxin
MTENHNYDTPEQGSTDWHVPLNTNFEQIDTDVEIRDSNTNRSDYTPKSGSKYLATDTGDVYIGDGSDWQHLGNIASETSDFTKVDANRFHHRPTQDREHENIVARDMISTEDIELYVATSGDDSNPGTQSAPLASLDEAFNRLPFILQHYVRIFVEPGTYDPGSTIFTGMHLVNFVNRYQGRDAPLVIEGAGDSPSDVHITGEFWWNTSIRGTVPYRTVIRNMEIDGKIQNYNGCIGLHDMILNVSSSHGAGQKSGVDGYAGFTQVKDCTFNTVDEAVHANMGHNIAVGYCDATNAGGTYKQKWGGNVWWSGTNSS